MASIWTLYKPEQPGDKWHLYADGKIAGVSVGLESALAYIRRMEEPED